MDKVSVESVEKTQVSQQAHRVTIGKLNSRTEERRVLPLMTSFVVLLMGVDLLFGRTQAAIWIEFLLAGGVLIMGHETLRRGAEKLIYRLRPDSESLLCVAALISFAYSFLVSVLFASGKLASAHWVEMSGGLPHPALYYTTTGLVILGATLGQELRNNWQRRIDRLFSAQWKDLIRGNAGTSSHVSGSRDWSSGTPLLEMSQRLSLYWVFAVFLLAGFAVAGGFLVNVGLNATVLGFMITFFVSSSPSAFSLLARSFQMLGAFRAGERGYILKSNKALEKLSRPAVFCFNKLGTLTVGCPQVTDILPLRPGFPADEVIYLAAVLQAQEEHPFREALLLELADSARTIPRVRGFRNVPGQGMRAVHQGQELLLGTKDYVENLGIDLSEYEEQINSLGAEGKSLLVLAQTEEPLGLIALNDERRDEAQEAIQELRRLGARSVLISSESQVSVEMLAKDLGVDRVRAGLSREGFQEAFREMREFGDVVVMVAGGVSNATLLAQADVGIAFGVGQEGLAEAADVVLRGEDLREVPRILNLVQQTRQSIHRGFAVLMATQGLCLLGVGGFWLAQIMNLKSQGDSTLLSFPSGLPYLPVCLGLLSALLPAFLVGWTFKRFDKIRSLDLEKVSGESL